MPVGARASLNTLSVMYVLSYETWEYSSNILGCKGQSCHPMYTAVIAITIKGLQQDRYGAFKALSVAILVPLLKYLGVIWE